ncbi:MAG: helix-turn-helix domain-containing protein, partial [Lachnospiraceae bacterium]|nr:helix-turn-helix domain-containing protein [Lachnospiraceae bacterium]
ITVLLADRARLGQPPAYTDDQIIRILEIACRTPEEYGYEPSHWSLDQLVDVVIREGIAESISAKTISRFLKYGENPPASRPLLAAFFRKSGKPGNLRRESE